MALAAKKSAPPRRDPRILPKPGIDRLDRLSYLGTMLGWVALLLGQRLQPRIQVSTYQAILRKLLLLLAIILIYQFISETGLITWQNAADG